jgi:acetate kinase
MTPEHVADRPHVNDRILSLNAGSSTLKYALYRGDEHGENKLHAETLDTNGAAHSTLLATVLTRAQSLFGAEPTHVGHRIVHGGAELSEPTRVDARLLARLKELIPLAPLHLPPALELLGAALDCYPAAAHVACFDTAFHHTLPEVARRFALPIELYEQGLRRYGFHGLSYEYVVSALGAPLPTRLVVAHLGSGASMTAILRGRSVDTSMGFTPAGGLPMGTRAGDLDPGVLIHLLRDRCRSVDELEQLLNHRSGLLGIAGSSDMAELVARAEAGDARARAGIELFAYAIKKQLGAYAAVLGGLDCVVFTGGIGEHAPLVRELACCNLDVFGIQLDAAKNAVNADVISRDSSPCVVRVIATDEDLIIARAARAVGTA